MSIPVEYIETVETTADGEEIHIAHSGGELEGSTVILDPVLQVSPISKNLTHKATNMAVLSCVIPDPVVVNLHYSTKGIHHS